MKKAQLLHAAALLPHVAHGRAELGGGGFGGVKEIRLVHGGNRGLFP